MKTKCPNCNVIFQAPDEYKGRRIKCPKCKQLFVVTKFIDPPEIKKTDDSPTKSSTSTAKTKKCPFCGEEIRTEATKCRFCGEWLNKKALKKCKQCGNLVSPQAKKCPSCGAPIRKPAWVWFGIIVLVVIIFSWMVSSPEQNSTTIKPHQPFSPRTKQTTKPRRPSSPQTKETTKPRRPSSPRTKETTKNKTQAKTVYKMGETVSIGYTSYVVWRAWWSNKLSDNEFLDEKPDASFLFVKLTVRNDDSKARTIPPFKLIDENGAEYETSSKAWAVEGGIGVLESLNPSVSKQGLIVFDVPRTHGYALKVSGGYWSRAYAFIVIVPE